jgi:hypothetical protein
MDYSKAKPLAENSKKKPRGKAFQKGVSGNAGGRPKLPDDIKHVRELAKSHTEDAITALVDVLSSDSASARVAAANALLDRGWGKAEQPIVGDANQPLVFSLATPWLTQSIAARNGD